MKRLMQFIVVAAVAVILAVVGCQSLFFFTGLKVPIGCKAKPGSVEEPYTKSGWAQSVIHKKTGIELVYVPAGTFMMGSPETEEDRYDNETQHKVTISKGFYMGKYEVTQAQYNKIMGTNPSGTKGDALPVETVSWDECQSFCKQAGLCLPTEAQWEYACRAGSTGMYGGSGVLVEMGWFADNSGRVIHAGGQKKPNAWGLYDMHGNVWEWCLDWLGAYPAGDVTDLTGAATGSDRVFRGGSWINFDAHGCRSANRNGIEPDSQGCDRGFRIVLPAVQ